MFARLGLNLTCAKGFLLILTWGYYSTHLILIVMCYDLYKKKLHHLRNLMSSSLAISAGLIVIFCRKPFSDFGPSMSMIAWMSEAKVAAVPQISITWSQKIRPSQNRSITWTFDSNSSNFQLPNAVFTPGFPHLFSERKGLTHDWPKVVAPAGCRRDDIGQSFPDRDSWRCFPMDLNTSWGCTWGMFWKGRRNFWNISLHGAHPKASEWSNIQRLEVLKRSPNKASQSIL